MSTDSDRPDNQLKRYVNHLILEMQQSKRALIQARFSGMENDRELRANLQGDIIDLYTSLKMNDTTNVKLWDTIELYKTKKGAVTGVDKIQEWEHMTETIEQENNDFSKSKNKITRPKIHNKHVLIQSAIALGKVASEMGFNATNPDNDDHGVT